MLSPLEIQRLPVAGRQQFVDVLNASESVGPWPAQLPLAICRAIPRPAGGDRVIGILPTTAGAGSRARSSSADRWPEALGEFSGTAPNHRQPSALPPREQRRTGALRLSIFFAASTLLGLGFSKTTGAL